MKLPLVLVTLAVGAAPALAQPETLLPRSALDGLAGTVSGSRPLAVLTDFTGYNRDRKADEFAGTWLESRLFVDKAAEYGFEGVEILRYPRGPLWDGIRGELWVTSPVLRKIVDFKDIPTALAPGSVSGTYEGEMVFLNDGGDPGAYAGIDVRGKIVVSGTGTGGSYNQAIANGALGVAAMNSPRPNITPDAIVWSSVRGAETGFAFNLSSRMVEDIRLLARGQPVQLRAIVEAEMRDVDNEVITAVIPGDGSTDEWIYYSAHIYEGINKQGAADDGSGAVIILEAGRTIIEAIERGYVSRPARNMRFLWVDEFSGTRAYLDSHAEEFAKVTADINIDMAGQNVTKNNNATRLYRMPDSRIHFVADVSQELFEWVGLTNIERVHDRAGGYHYTFPIVDPYGTRDAWRYVIEPFYGSSDHQVYNDRGVPAVLFNHWPDMVYHTSHDRPDMMDATQMKRAAFIAAAAGLVTAGVKEAPPMTVATEAYNRSKARIAADTRNWTVALAAMPTPELAAGYKDLIAALPQWYLREDRNVRSVLDLTRGSSSANPDAEVAGINALAISLSEARFVDHRALWTFYSNLAQSRSVEPVTPAPTELEIEAAGLVPTRVETPVVEAAARGGGRGGNRGGGRGNRGGGRGAGGGPRLPGFAGMEVSNFIDGRRSALDIRNAVNSEYALEYGSISLEAVLANLRAMEASGQIQLVSR